MQPAAPAAAPVRPAAPFARRGLQGISKLPRTQGTPGTCRWGGCGTGAEDAASARSLGKSFRKLRFGARPLAQSAHRLPAGGTQLRAGRLHLALAQEVGTQTTKACNGQHRWRGLSGLDPHLTFISRPKLPPQVPESVRTSVLCGVAVPLHSDPRVRTSGAVVW